MPMSQRSLETWNVVRRDHPGSKSEEIEAEPDWAQQSNDHFPGYKNSRGRRAGLVGADDWRDESDESDWAAAKDVMRGMKQKADSKTARLVNWQDAIGSEKDVALYHPEGHPFGWRYVLDYTEDEIRNDQEWPANITRREKEDESEESKGDKKDQAKSNAPSQDKSDESSDNDGGPDSQGQGAKEDSTESGNDIKSGNDTKSDNDTKSTDDSDKHMADGPSRSLSSQLQEEQEHMANLKTNDGKGTSGVTNNRTDLSISEDDQFTPDNWIPRSPDLIRLTGKHPLNAEPDLRQLFDAGFITPNEIHYVRSHGAVPRLVWEYHQLEITTFDGRKTRFSMDKIKSGFDSINIPVYIGCDNGRRKELNMFKRTHGFNWGPGASGCAFWKGPLLRDVLLAAGVPERMPHGDTKRYWVHLQGADNPGSALYETCLPFEYAMDSVNDVILAYEMNDVILPPDHGYPLRVVIPGYVGGRQVKWLQKIWINDKENDSYWHIWDNRMVPPFVKSQDDELAKIMFHHPDTALYEQGLNSIIARPAQGERVSLQAMGKNDSYRVCGFASDGRGDQVRRVEITLDGGKSWLYCTRTFPNAPIRHGKKFWTWCFWHVDVPVSRLISAKSIRARAWDVKMLTQPEEPTWNLMGSMNNVQYVVKPSVTTEETLSLLFRHPVEPGSGEGGWMKESAENKISDAQKQTQAPNKQFTRAEIEKHDKQDDCWIVVDGKVYDATSVMSWHPGGAAPIMMHAGAVHYATTQEFSSVHDDHAYEKLNECVLGVVTDKAMSLIEKSKSDESNSDADVPKDQTLYQHRWVQVTLQKREWLNEDTAVYTFALPKGKPFLGLGTCQHIEVGFHLRDRLLFRQYTPTRPVLPRDSVRHVSVEHGESERLRDGSGSFELTVKTYFPDRQQPGGALSNILAALKVGEGIDMRGPTGNIVYNGQGSFTINGENRHFTRVSMVLGGTGVTPGFSLIARVALDSEDETQVRVLYANKTESDILLREELDHYSQVDQERVCVTHILSHPSDEWTGLKGHIGEESIQQTLFPPNKDESLVLVCGPPGMIQKAAVPALEAWGFSQNQDLFGL